MPSRSRRSSRSSRRIWFLVAAFLGLAAGVAGLKWLVTDRGRLFLADRDLGPARPWAEEHVEAAVREGLRRAGVDLTRDDPYKAMLDLFENTIREFERIYSS